MSVVQLHPSFSAGWNTIGQSTSREASVTMSDIDEVTPVDLRIPDQSSRPRPIGEQRVADHVEHVGADGYGIPTITSIADQTMSPTAQHT